MKNATIREVNLIGCFLMGGVIQSVNIIPFLPGKNNKTAKTVFWGVSWRGYVRYNM